MIVVDTSVLVELFRGKQSKGVDLLESIIQAEMEFGIPAPCLQEILQGTRDLREFNFVDSFVSKQRILTPKDYNSYRDAARIAFDCRRKGKTIRSTIDCLVAQITLENSGVLLHEDRDYEAIKVVRPLKFLM